MKVSIKNYQSILDAELEFVNGINIICGGSRQGKSAIFRGITALLTNQQGKSFISHWAETTEITIDDVAWVKGVKGIFYDINGKRYERLGSNVPEDVYKNLSIYLVDFDDTKILLNFSIQGELPFLLTESASRVAKLFGVFSNVYDVYSAINACSKDIKQNQQKLNYIHTRIEEIELSIETIPVTENIYPTLELYEKFLKFSLLLKQYIEVEIPPKSNIDDIILLRQYLDILSKKTTIIDVDLDKNIIVHIELLRKYLQLQYELHSLVEEIVEMDGQEDLCPYCGKPL